MGFKPENYLSGFGAGRSILQFILRATDEFEQDWPIWSSKLSGLKISDNMGFKPENYLWGFEAGRSIMTKIMASEHFQYSIDDPVVHWFRLIESIQHTYMGTISGKN